jgi:hypothetical protein
MGMRWHMKCTHLPRELNRYSSEYTMVVLPHPCGALMPICLRHTPQTNTPQKHHKCAVAQVPFFHIFWFSRRCWHCIQRLWESTWSNLLGDQCSSRTNIRVWASSCGFLSHTTRGGTESSPSPYFEVWSSNSHLHHRKTGT